ncbi:hypothetical protein B0T09DRAFT_344936 [Sordaria sp. MPI-SDFR-AT-0083]|nr:hypothetical protein B0T09DRAFT_344936 [Sordaria sp. MPI-SDFR-AT-0083]
MVVDGRAVVKVALGVALRAALHVVAGDGGGNYVLRMRAESVVPQHAVACEDGCLFVAHVGRLCLVIRSSS